MRPECYWFGCVERLLDLSIKQLIWCLWNMDLIYNDVGGSSCSIDSSREERKNKGVLVVVIGISCCLN